MTDRAKHTPGPWEIVETNYPTGKIYGVRNEVWAAPNPYPSDPILGTSWRTEKKADALLISAAPELLEACEAAFERLTDNDCMNVVGDDLRRLLWSAIAKGTEQTTAKRKEEIVDRVKHTPGPWRHTGNNQSLNHYGEVVHAEKWGTFPLVTVQPRHNGDPEATANARLIAAAPDLLASCKLLVESMQTGKSEGFQSGLAAIAKSGG